MSKIIPLRDYVLVQQEEINKVSKHGIVKPDSEEEEQKTIATVIETGADVKEVKVGEKVIFGAYSGDKIETGEDGETKEDYILLKEEYILAILKD